LKRARLTVGTLTQEQLMGVRNGDKVVWVERDKYSDPGSGRDDEGTDPL
jgi:hypothetical protein